MKTFCKNFLSSWTRESHHYKQSELCPKYHMIGMLESRYPFLRSSMEIASQNGADIDALLTSPSFEDARKRGVERLESALRGSEVNYVAHSTDYDRIMEIMSYPYARILASCLNDRYLTNRYALAEAVHMNRLLSGEPQGVVLQIAHELEVKSVLENEKLKMHFSDFLRFTTRIKSSEWKLVNQEIYQGYVYLTREKFARVLQNALHDRILSELPLPVPPEFNGIVNRDLETVRNIMMDCKNKYEMKYTGELKPEDLPPCIRTLLANAQNGVNLAHSGRFALVSFLHAIGLDLEQILALFSQSPDFDESKSIYQIKHITGDLNGTEGYTPPECSTMKTHGICFDPDNLCANERMNHPLNYFRIKTKSYQKKDE